MSDLQLINGAALKGCREALGWSQGEVASRACLSIKQVKQLEEGGLGSFYSENVKLTAARKVGSILGLSEADLFGQPDSHQLEQNESLHRAQATNKNTESPLGNESSTYSAISKYAAVQENNSIQGTNDREFLESASSNSIARADGAQPDVDNRAGHILTPGVHALKLRSEALHVLAQPPEDGADDHFPDPSTHQNPLDEHAGDHYNEASADPASEPIASHELSTSGALNPEIKDFHGLAADASITLEPSLQGTNSQEHQQSEQEVQTQTSTTSNFFKIVILFLLALGLAAFFAQKNNEEHAEPPPSLQPLSEPSSAADVDNKTEEQAAQNKSTTASPPQSNNGATPVGSPPGTNSSNRVANGSNGANNVTKSSVSSVPSSPSTPSSSSSSNTTARSLAPSGTNGNAAKPDTSATGTTVNTSNKPSVSVVPSAASQTSSSIAPSPAAPPASSATTVPITSPASVSPSN